MARRFIEEPASVASRLTTQSRASSTSYTFADNPSISHAVIVASEDRRAYAQGMHTMVAKTTTIRITTETSLASLLDEAAKGPVLLERDGELFRLERKDDIAYEPDPDYVRATLAATAGSWADLDVGKIIADIYEARRAGSRPPDRP